MPRYFTRATVSKREMVRADDYCAETPPYVTNLTVCDHEATDTGLLDQNGDPIMRAPREMGFGRDID
jgi:hypothetical protein